MPEGDSLHRAAQRLQVLVGERVEVETPHPRAAVKGLADRLDGRRLEQVAAQDETALEAEQKILPHRLHLFEPPAVESLREPLYRGAWMRRLDLDALTD